MAKKIGITMRIDTAAGHGERRDSLARDWANFMNRMCPGIPWMPLPNLGEAIIDHVQQWNIDAVIFSGGKLELRKGQDLVVAAFKIFHARHPDALLISSWQNGWPESAMNKPPRST